MRFLIALIVLIVTTNAADWTLLSSDEVYAAQAACLKENNVPSNIVEQIMRFEYPDDPSVRCGVRCMSLRADNFNDQTGYDVDRSIAQLAVIGSTVKREDALKCIDNNEVKSDSCTWAFRQFKCMLDNKYVPKPTVH